MAMKVTIVGGAGAVGAAAAYRIAQEKQASEILMIDTRKDLVEAHALDIEQAVACRSATRVRAGGLEDTAGSDVIVMTAGVPHRATAARSDFLSDNLSIITELAEKLIVHSPSAVWIMVTVPVDTYCYLIHKLFGIPRSKIIGLNRNDTCRFRWAIARVLRVPSTTVEAYVLGEHGQTQVPIYSLVRVNGQPCILNAEQKELVKKEISGFFQEWNRLSPNRTAGWTSAESVGYLLAAMQQEMPIWNCSTPLEGEYGLSEVSVGVPVKLTKSGVREIVDFALSPEEKEALALSAEAIRREIMAAWRLLGRSAPGS